MSFHTFLESQGGSLMIGLEFLVLSELQPKVILTFPYLYT